MTSERIAGIRINLNVASQQELEVLEQHARRRLEEAKEELWIIQDYHYRRFGRPAMHDIDAPCDREFELDLEIEQ